MLFIAVYKHILNKIVITKDICRYGHIMKLLDTHWPNKVLAVLEGGYFSTSYTECASMAVRGLKVSICNIFT